MSKLLNKIGQNSKIAFRNKINSKKKNKVLNDFCSLIIKIRNFCKKQGRNFYLANDVKLAIKYNLDGVYIPSFNKDLKHLNYKIKPNFLAL